MNDFLAALGLFLVFEGLFYGGFPKLVKAMAADVGAVPDQVLRVAGLAAMMLGVLVVWLVRG